MSQDKGYQYYKNVVDSVHDSIVVINRQLEITMMNASALALFQVESIEGHSIDDFLPARFQNKHDQHLSDFEQGGALSRKMHARNIVMGRKSDGSEVPLEITISKFLAGGDDQYEYVAVLRDCSDHVEYVGELKKVASIDPLTGLYNRRHFEECCIKELQRSDRYDHPVSLALLDLDNFKEVNDQQGHNAGDKLLVEFSQTLKDKIRVADVIARWGGDEFIVLLPETSINDARAWAENLQDSVTEVLQAQSVTLSGGLASREAGESFDQLFERVDKLLYRAKEQGKNKIVG